jgi:hypothetical protein
VTQRVIVPTARKNFYIFFAWKGRGRAAYFGGIYFSGIGKRKLASLSKAEKEKKADNTKKIKDQPRRKNRNATTKYSGAFHYTRSPAH